jgi:LPS-assembly lipoprotein
MTPMRSARHCGYGDFLKRLACRFAGWAFCIAAVIALSACGFHLRGKTTLPFESLYIQGNAPMLVELKRNVAAGTQTKLVDQAAGADAIFALDHEVREKVILSLDTSGRVREYQLRYRVGFRVYDAKGRDWIGTSDIELSRDIPFNDAQVLAKEGEEALLYRDMQTDMVQQIVRRLAAARLASAQ